MEVRRCARKQMRRMQEGGGGGVGEEWAEGWRGPPVQLRDRAAQNSVPDAGFSLTADSRILPSMVNKPEDPASVGRIQQLRIAAGMIRKANPWALPIVALVGVGVLLVFVVVGLVTGLVAFFAPLGVLSGLAAAIIVFGRYAQSAQYSAIEGQPGAAAAILQTMRGGWTVTPAVAANR